MNCLDVVAPIADQLYSASSVLLEITQDSALKLISASDDGVCGVLGLMHSVRFGLSARCACFLKKLIFALLKCLKIYIICIIIILHLQSLISSFS